MIVSWGLPSGAGCGRPERRQLAGVDLDGHAGAGHGGAAIASAGVRQNVGPCTADISLLL
jgi:hypothetical protein